MYKHLSYIDISIHSSHSHEWSPPYGQHEKKKKEKESKTQIKRCATHEL